MLWLKKTREEFSLNTIYSQYDLNSTSNVTLPQTGKSATLTITNGLGIETELWHGFATGQTEQINIPASLASGMYLLKAGTLGKVVTHKFMIVK